MMDSVNLITCHILDDDTDADYTYQLLHNLQDHVNDSAVLLTVLQVKSHSISKPVLTIADVRELSKEADRDGKGVSLIDYETSGEKIVDSYDDVINTVKEICVAHQPHDLVMLIYFDNHRYSVQWQFMDICDAVILIRTHQLPTIPADKGVCCFGFADKKLKLNELILTLKERTKVNQPSGDKLNLNNIKLHVSDPAKGKILKFDSLEDRLKTFQLPPQWEGPVDYQSMAEAGFVYTGQEDLVSCFSCNIKLDGWTKHMDPLLRHKEESPTCSFVRQKLLAVKGEKGKSKTVVAPSKPLNPRLTSSVGQLRYSDLVTSKPIHTVVTGLNERRVSYRGSVDDRPGASLPITPENYQCEEERMRSFIGWPLNEAVHPEQLARVGFVYTGDGALVQCFQCGIKYRHWYKGDVPLNVHQKYNPRCAFIQTLGSESKPTISERRPTKSYIQLESLPSNLIEGEEVSKHCLQFPDYSDEATRLGSFKYWGGVVPAQELAEAGFYMIARRDVVRCFSCNVVLQEWESSDNVINEHHRHSPNCSFLKAFLSNKAVGGVSSPLPSSKITESITDTEKSAMKSKEECLLQNEIRLPPSLKSGGSSKSPDIVEDEPIPGMYYPPSWRESRPLSPPGAPGKELEDHSDDSFHSAESHHKSDYNLLTSIDPPKTKIMYEESLSEGLENNINIKTASNKEDDATGKGLCQICYMNQINCIFLPCGHARTCEECATRIKNSGQPCPYCRKEVATTHRIFL